MQPQTSVDYKVFFVALYPLSSSNSNIVLLYSVSFILTILFCKSLSIKKKIYYLHCYLDFQISFLHLMKRMQMQVLKLSIYSPTPTLFFGHSSKNSLIKTGIEFMLLSFTSELCKCITPLKSKYLKTDHNLETLVLTHIFSQNLPPP